MKKIKGLTIGQLLENIKHTALYQDALKEVPKKPVDLIIEDAIEYTAFDNEITKALLIQDLSLVDENINVYYTYTDDNKRILIF